MSHPEQVNFLTKSLNPIKASLSDDTVILEIGSLCINGTSRDLFDNLNPIYFGVDITHGASVDALIPGELLQLPDAWADIVICTEVFEHAKDWQLIMKNIARVSKPGGLVLVTCASHGRQAHGVSYASSEDSPTTSDYYKNILPHQFTSIDGLLAWYDTYSVEFCHSPGDLYFSGRRSSYTFSHNDLTSCEELLSAARGQVGQLATTIAQLNKINSALEADLAIHRRENNSLQIIKQKYQMALDYILTIEARLVKTRSKLDWNRRNLDAAVAALKTTHNLHLKIHNLFDRFAGIGMARQQNG